MSAGLWPMPARGPLDARVFGQIARGDYSVEKVYIEGHPGFYVTGNLCRPLGQTALFRACCHRTATVRRARSKTTAPARQRRRANSTDRSSAGADGARRETARRRASTRAPAEPAREGPTRRRNRRPSSRPRTSSASVMPSV